MANHLNFSINRHRRNYTAARAPHTVDSDEQMLEQVVGAPDRKQ